MRTASPVSCGALTPAHKAAKDKAMPTATIPNNTLVVFMSPSSRLFLRVIYIQDLWKMGRA